MPDADDDRGIGSRVRAARRRRGWSREALAFHAGISWSAIRQLEAGRRRNLRPGTVAALAVTTPAHCDLLRERLRDAAPRVEFADRASWCHTPAGALTRTRTFVERHLSVGSHWIRILVEPVTAELSELEIPLWGKVRGASRRPRAPRGTPVAG